MAGLRDLERAADDAPVAQPTEAHDAGWTFEFQPRPSGGAWQLRGLVSFQWRRVGRVVDRDRRVTEEGHSGTAGAEPPDFSDDTCAIA